MAAVLATMAQQTIRRHPGGPREWVYLHRTDQDSQHQLQCHLCPECHLRHLVAQIVLTDPKSKICHTAMHIDMFLFPKLNFSILIHMPGIACAINSVYQIY